MKKKRVDRNQPLAVAALRTLGFLVEPVHAKGGGFPDLVVAGDDNHGGACDMVLVELKCNDWLFPPSHPRWQTTLTPDERAWHVDWRHAPVIITNRVRYVLDWFSWYPDEIKTALAALPDNPLVRAALAAVKRKYGTVEDDVMATILWE